MCDDAVEQDALVCRECGLEIGVCPLATDVPDLCGDVFYLVVEQFEEERRLCGCEA